MNFLAYHQRTFGHACSAVLHAVKRASETLQRISWPAPRTRSSARTVSLGLLALFVVTFVGYLFLDAAHLLPLSLHSDQ
jgi:hypothetical protein